MLSCPAHACLFCCCLSLCSLRSSLCLSCQCVVLSWRVGALSTSPEVFLHAASLFSSQFFACSCSTQVAQWHWRTAAAFEQSVQPPRAAALARSAAQSCSVSPRTQQQSRFPETATSFRSRQYPHRQPLHRNPCSFVVSIVHHLTQTNFRAYQSCCSCTSLGVHGQRTSFHGPS
jgi:hypothetical protein